MPRQRLLSPAFLLVSAANLTQALAFNLFLHLPGSLESLGADKVEIGLLFGLTSISAIAVRPAVGRSMDLRGRRGVILVGGVLNVAVCALYLTVDAIGPWLYTVRLVHGLAEALLFTSLFTFAADTVPAERRTEGLALFGVSGMLPISLGGLLGDAILARADFDALFGVALGFGIVSLLLSLGLFDPPRAEGRGEPSRGFAAALRQRDLIPLWWIGTVFATALAANFAFLKTYVLDTGIGSVGGFFTAYSGAALALRLFFGWLPDRVGPKRVLFPSLGALAAGLALLAVAERSAEVFAAGLVCGIGHGYIFPILFGMVVSRAREAERGSAMAIFTALFDGGVLIGGPTFGWMHRIGGYGALFGSAALVVVAGTLVFAWLDRGR